ncbi:MAG: DUF6359 domain-containing protein [Bacteroidales bacterium]|nr:DUF6359 domain-containing protein [Bacteroidales bacterium]
MKKVCCLFCFLMLLGSIVSCGKLELPTTDEEQQEKPDTGEDELPDDFCSVADLKPLEKGHYVAVAGYIVGFVPSGKIGNMVFGTKNAVETNVVIADSPDETNPQNCAAVQLMKNTYVRDEVNLSFFPDNLHRLICVFGMVDEYYGAPGLKNCDAYQWLDEEDDDDDGEVGEGEDDSEASQKCFFPVLDIPAEVLEGD